MFASTNNSNGAVPHFPQPRSFMVGQDRAGRWIAVEPHGLAGGIFVSRKAALDYAEFESDHRPGAVLVVNEPVELKL
jgi:hypothetical protein